MKYYHHSSIKNYTIALLDLFNDIHIVRYDDEEGREYDFKVPIIFGSKEKAFHLDSIETQNILNGNVNVLPKIVLSFEGMSKAPMRNTNKLARLDHKKQYNSVSYDFQFTMYIATRTFTDATIIIEQIAPLFRPDYSVKINEIDIQEEPTTIPVTIGDFSIVLPDTTSEDELRIIEVDVPLTIKGNLYLPLTDPKLITKLKVNYFLIEDKYQLDTSLF